MCGARHRQHNSSRIAAGMLCRAPPHCFYSALSTLCGEAFRQQPDIQRPQKLEGACREGW